MNQTAEQLIDKLQLAIFNVDEWDRVCLDIDDAKSIGAQLRLLVEADHGEKRLGLTPREVAIYRTLVGATEPVSARQLVAASGCKTLGSLWVHKRRLMVKLQQHRAGDIDTVRGKGYQLVGGAK